MMGRRFHRHILPESLWAKYAIKGVKKVKTPRPANTYRGAIMNRLKHTKVHHG